MSEAQSMKERTPHVGPAGWGAATFRNPIAIAKAAQGAALRAQADALDLEAAAIEASAPAEDTWIVLRPKETIAGFGIHGRVVVDAGRRGELELSKLGGKPCVKRSELSRWAESRRKTPKERVAGVDNDYDAIVARSRTARSRR
jgi:hypothetical protein